jgi:tRNA A37 methylthiotransferase MiaB
VRPDIRNITRFSPRPGTPAADLKPLPGGVVKERSRLLTDLHARIALERNRDRVGTVDTALVVEPARGGVMARDSTYRPVVLASGYIGRFYRVRITGYGRVNLFGEVTGPAGPV